MNKQLRNKNENKYEKAKKIEKTRNDDKVQKIK